MALSILALNVTTMSELTSAFGLLTVGVLDISVIGGGTLMVMTAVAVLQALVLILKVKVVLGMPLALDDYLRGGAADLLSGGDIYVGKLENAGSRQGGHFQHGSGFVLHIGETKVGRGEGITGVHGGGD